MNTPGSKHDAPLCPRCGQTFQCRINTPWRCDCLDIPLTPDEVEYIRDHSDGQCLCIPCLLALKATFAAYQSVSSSASPPPASSTCAST